jgi:hypothetical protein
MPKAKSAILLLVAAGLLALNGCGGGSQSSTLNLSGQWNFIASPSTSGTVSLAQNGHGITGTLSASGYSDTAITGSLNGSSFQATITGTYGPYACGEGIISIDITIDLTGTVAAGGNSLSGQFVMQPTTCFSGNSGNWSATRS